MDSGNFAGCLLALEHGCREVAAGPVLRPEEWEGLRDTLELMEEVVESVPKSVASALSSVLARMQQAALRARDNPGEAPATLRGLCDGLSAELDQHPAHLPRERRAAPRGRSLHALRTSIERLHQQLQQMRRELDALLPWLALNEDAAALAIAFPAEVRLDQVPALARRLGSELEARQLERRGRGEASAALDAAAQRLGEAFRAGEANATELVAELHGLAARAEEEVRGMDFKLLYDAERKLFHIGYNVTVDRLDAHHYDLLASEARLASYLAIVKREVPLSHWYALGRPMAQVAGAPALLSWGGTMFEYLMPAPA